MTTSVDGVVLYDVIKTGKLLRTSYRTKLSTLVVISHIRKQF